ncbi:hypothetical protein Y032_0064g3533 [Ancylostoma ceylanicum]|uniref:Uncharacterized protein n=1 Tax=Ancylostoma ceylanicum TaxID=53326 RepID=A0A016U112_9BILA|nr:hypothetical protein Y032_0064g3533 [Ancylostoma ceylanicum]
MSAIPPLLSKTNTNGRPNINGRDELDEDRKRRQTSSKMDGYSKGRAIQRTTLTARERVFERESTRGLRT